MLPAGGWPAAMEEALREARAAAAHGDVPVGAVVVGPEGDIIGRGHNERERTGDPLAHAEIVALTAAARARGAWRFDDCALVVTLEPCTMCAGAVTQARVGRLVYGALDPKAGAVASLFDVVRDPRLPHRCEVVGGIGAAAARALLTEFFATRR